MYAIVTFSSSYECREGRLLNQQGYLQRHADREGLLLVVDLPVVQEQLELALVEAQHAVQLHAPVALVHEVILRVHGATALSVAVALRRHCGVNHHRLQQRRAHVQLL